MLSILTFVLLTKTCLASDYWISKWSETHVGPDGPWHALNISWDNDPLQTFAMLPSLTKTSLLIAADACSSQTSTCPNQVPSGDWPMWTSSEAHESYLVMDGTLFDADSWDNTVSWPLNITGDAQSAHERAILWNTNNDSLLLSYQAITLTHNFTANFPTGEGYTMNTGFFSLYGAEKSASWLNATGSNVTQYLQLATVQNISAISSLSYGLHIGSPSLNMTPSLVLGGYDRSRCLTEPTTTQNETFQLIDISVGAAGSDWPFIIAHHDATNLSANSQTGLLGDDSSLQILANPGVPYLYLPRNTCDAIARYIPVSYDSGLGLYTWNTDDRHYTEIVKKLTYLSFNFKSSPDGQEQPIQVPFALLDLVLDYPLTTTKTRYFPCSPFIPHEGQPYHLGRAFLQAALLAQNWETNTTWLSQAPGPDATDPSRPVTIEETDTTITIMPNPPDWVETWNTTFPPSNWTMGSPQGSSSPSKSSGLSSGATAGVVIGAVAFVAIIAAAIFFFIRRRRSKHEYGDVALISFADSEISPPRGSELESKPTVEAASSPIHEVESTEKRPPMVELSSDPPKVHPVEVDGIGIAELPGHDVDHR